MTSKRIDDDFVARFNQMFTEEVARKYCAAHWENCHHWDFTFLLWHRKFTNSFWSDLELPRTYAVLTDEEDRKLYRSLRKTLLQRSGSLAYLEDPNKLNSFVPQDQQQIEMNIAESMVSSAFALDLDFDGRNVDFGEYNLSFTSQVEEFHDILHGETGLGMRAVRTAGGDQCFFVLHTYVDLVFETWLHRNPGMQFPFSEKHYNESQDLQKDYGSYDELLGLWKTRHFTQDDYKHVLRISAPLSRQVIVFDNIAHTEDYRRVILYHDQREIGRFAVLTGRIDTCLTCARRESHQGQFLLRELVPISEISWNINRRTYTWEGAKARFAELGMSQPYIVSF